jgi:hypothetical protein
MFVSINIPTTIPGVGRFQASSPEQLNERVRTVTTNLAHTATAGEDFADQLRKAVAARCPTATRTVKEAREQAERERARYRPFQRRQRTKGE